jgi:hypothetical protein
VQQEGESATTPHVLFAFLSREEAEAYSSEERRKKIIVVLHLEL